MQPFHLRPNQFFHQKTAKKAQKVIVFFLKNWDKRRNSGLKRALMKNLQKWPKKSVFWPNFDQFSTIKQKLSNIWCSPFHYISGTNFKSSLPHLGKLWPEKQYRSSPKSGNTGSVISIFNNVRIKKYWKKACKQQTDNYLLNY